MNKFKAILEESAGNAAKATVMATTHMPSGLLIGSLDGLRLWFEKNATRSVK